MSPESAKSWSSGDNPSRLKPMVLPTALTLAAIGLGLLTIQLPFTAGRPLLDLFAPLGALVCGAGGFILAIQRRRGAKDAARAWLLVLGVLAALIVLAATLMLLLIFGLCGAYWTRTSC